VSSFLEELGGITGGVGAEGLAFAAGFAAAHALGPAAEKIAQEAWNGAPDKRLPVGEAAAAAAERLASEATMAAEASYSGFDSSRFAYFYDLALTAPGTGELLNMLRRDDEVSIDFAHGLRKAKLETRWDAALRNLRWQRISATDLAYMVVRGIVPDGGTLGSSLPTSGDNLTLPPQHTLDTLAEAARTGWDADRFAMLVQRSGLAMAPVMAAQAFYRGILTRKDYDLTIARGDLYPSFADPVLEVSRQIPTVGEMVEAQLRGYYDDAGRHLQTQRHGMRNPDSDLLYFVAGRAPSIRQTYIGMARGAKYPATYDDIPEPFRTAYRRSNRIESFADVDYQNRYSLPSAFVVRALLSDGAISPDRGRSILEHSGWPPDLAQLVSEHYSAGGTVGTDPHVTKAQTRLWTTMQTSYISGETQASDLGPGFQALGVPAAAQATITGLWDTTREIERKQLTAAQVKKAAAEGVNNPATGAPWTTADAVARLMSMGYSAADATVFMQI
jgi:hypothetical protein